MAFVPRAAGSYLRELRSPRGFEPILYVHGLGESGACFIHIAASPELHASVALVPDLPGHGRSVRPATPPSVVDLAEQLAMLIQERVGDPVTVLGHSLGGVVGLLLAEPHPSLVNALVNVEGNVSDDDCFLSGMAARHSPRAFVAAGFEEIRRWVGRTGRSSAALPSYYERMSDCDPAVFHALACELVALSAAGELAPRLARLSIPCLYVAGDQRLGGIGERSRRLLDEAGVRTTAIEGAGHWPFIDAPQAFVRVVQEFLSAGDRFVRRSRRPGARPAR